MAFYTMYNNNYNVDFTVLATCSDGQLLRTYDSDRVHLTISAFTLLTSTPASRSHYLRYSVGSLDDQGDGLNCVDPLHAIQGQWKPVNTVQHLMMAWRIKSHLISLPLVISARWLFA